MRPRDGHACDARREWGGVEGEGEGERLKLGVGTEIASLPISGAEIAFCRSRCADESPPRTAGWHLTLVGRGI